MICPMIGKRATRADVKLAAPFDRSIGSLTCVATTRLLYPGPLFPESERMQSVIAHRCSGVSASTNDGMGVPLNPVLIVLKISSRVAPHRRVHGSARSAARIAWPHSAVSVGPEGP